MKLPEEFDYEPTDLDDEMFLSEVPLGLLEKSITTQFDFPAEYRKKDYIESFITRYEYTKEEVLDTEQDEKIVTDLYDDFLSFMMKVFQTYLDVGFDCIDDKPEEDALELLHMTYRFFITNIKKNYVNVIMNYIEEHKEIVIQAVSIKNDVTIISLTNQGVSEDDASLVANLSDVIDYVLGQPLTAEEFLQLCVTNKPCLETEFVKDNFDDFVITGNFVPKYIKMVDEDLRSTLESKIRNKILRNYPNRKKKVADLVDAVVQADEE